jgi:hypothetical protein
MRGVYDSLLNLDDTYSGVQAIQNTGCAATQYYDKTEITGKIASVFAQKKEDKNLSRICMYYPMNKYAEVPVKQPVY